MTVVPWVEALVEMESVKEYMALRDASDDGKLQSTINEVSADCQNRFCKRLFLTRTVTNEKHDGDRTAEIVTNQWPITSVTSLVIEKGGSALVEDTDFFVYGEDGIIRLDGRVTPTSLQQVVITYVAGYADLASLPLDLVHSVKAAVAFRFRSVDKKTEGVLTQALNVGGTQQTMERVRSDYPEVVLEIWKHYRRKRSE
jgi:hypothetical protein